MARPANKKETNDIIENENVSIYTPIEDDNKEVALEEQPLKLDEKVTLRNLASWPVGFIRNESPGDISIPANGTIRLTRSEVIAQSQNGNKLINGIDSLGSHATVYIEDKRTRLELNFDSPNSEQQIISEKKIKDIFEEKDEKEFENRLSDLVKTRFEKQFLKETVAKLNLASSASFNKMQYALNLCKFRLR